MNQTEKQYDEVAELLVEYHTRDLAKLKDIYSIFSENEVAKNIINCCQFMEDIKNLISETFIRRLKDTTDDTLSRSLKTLTYFPALGTSELALKVWSKYVVTSVSEYNQLNHDNVERAKGTNRCYFPCVFSN